MLISKDKIVFFASCCKTNLAGCVYRHSLHTQQCCYGRVMAKSSKCILSKCGAWSYNPLSHGCCAGKYRYNLSTQMCCHGRVIYKGALCLPRCGFLKYNPAFQGCCSGRYRYFLKNRKCCDGRVASISRKC